MRYYYKPDGLHPIALSEEQLFREYYGEEIAVNVANMRSFRWLLRNERILFLPTTENYHYYEFKIGTLSLDTAPLFAKKLILRGDSMLIFAINKELPESNHEQDIGFRFFHVPHSVFDGYLRNQIIDQFLADNL